MGGGRHGAARCLPPLVSFNFARAAPHPRLVPCGAVRSKPAVQCTLALGRRLGDTLEGRRKRLTLRGRGQPLRRREWAI